jgi:hypothetical protein
MCGRAWTALLLLGLSGCSAFPEVVHEPQYHNPFPQLTRVAVLPFFNQSAEPTVDQDLVALAYYNELQQIPGFEVVPVGVTKQLVLAWQQSEATTAAPPANAGGVRNVQASDGEGAPPSTEATFSGPLTGSDFQRLAQFMDVDAVVVGSVTEYSPYYPPRMGLSVRWYAANPGFHPIPPGYGLPWGTAQEEFIPDSLVFEAEHALAREQLKTQAPGPAPAPAIGSGVAAEGAGPEQLPSAPQPLDPRLSARGADLPPDWPDPRGFVPPPPSPVRPPLLPQQEPVLSHTRLYHGNDADFTQQLANYYYFRDEARFGGWQGYLQRSEDFIRFCCHLHIAEMLAARGGAGKTRVVWRWPIGRYEP